jgi:hypothetical protein
MYLLDEPRDTTHGKKYPTCNPKAEISRLNVFVKNKIKN